MLGLAGMSKFIIKEGRKSCFIEPIFKVFLNNDLASVQSMRYGFKYFLLYFVRNKFSHL